ncbi:MAG: DUF4445 domain-containing protein [Lachnospiraceae bacterium]|nr:DUF4445 domain-containing protein [Lachnospiraceae bacterium]
MSELLQRDDFQIEISKELVFFYLDCREDSPVYEAVEEEWEELQEEAFRLLRPQAIVVLDQCERSYGRKDLQESSQVIYVFQTIGKELGQMGARLFAQGDTFGGMMVDAMADAAFSSLAVQVEEWVRKICRDKGIGIRRRLEAAHELPMEAQQWIMEKTQADIRLGVRVSSGYMYDPVKSSGCILVTTKETELFHYQHNCRNCDRKDCKMRNIQPITIKVKGEPDQEIICTGEESILEALVRGNEAYTFPCGGRGVCGKCRIQLLEGELAETPEDQRFFTEEERKEGYRLACCAYPAEDVVIRFCGEKEEEFEVLAEAEPELERTNVRKKAAPYYIAVDMGTTTLAVSLTESKTRKTLQVYTAINRQRKFGADVISRIQASCEGKGEELQQTIREDLAEGIQQVLEMAGIKEEEVGVISIAGNTTMGHLLMGLSCETLGVTPFTPVDISMRELSFQEVFGDQSLHIPVLLLPGISTYVGADITAGMFYCGFAEEDRTSVLIDLGTNGEMAIGNKERILVTSTAAGPAFEGGNISWGIGSVPGAISDVVIEEGNVELTTIGEKTPAGICGTGAIAIMAELLKQEWVDETGLLDEEYFDDGFPIATAESGEQIVFTQKDVREMQLAIAAVRAGLETLLLRYGTDYEGVDRVFLAGGFGYKMNLEKAAATGLLPKELLGKIEAVGNSALGGAKEAVLQEGAKEKLEQLCRISQEVSLSADKDFNNFYMEYMMFE